MDLRFEVLDGLISAARNDRLTVTEKAALYAAADAWTRHALQIIGDGTPPYEVEARRYLKAFLSNFSIALGFGIYDAPDERDFLRFAAEDLYKMRGLFRA